MLWRKHIHTAGEHQRGDQHRKQVVRALSETGEPVHIPDKIYVVDTVSGKQLLRISRRDYSEQPDRDFWIRKALSSNPGYSADSLTLDYSRS